MNDLTAVLLAGGSSQRMGKDKAMIPLPDGRPWALAIAQTLAKVSSTILVVTGPGVRYRTMPFPVGTELYADHVPNHGPIGGIHTAFERTKSEFMLVVTCDMPDLSVDSIHELGRPEPDEQIRYTDEMYFPFVIRNTPEVEAIVKEQIAADAFSIHGLFSRLRGKEFGSSSTPSRTETPRRTSETSALGSVRPV